MATKTRAKWGYLTYADMLQKIEEGKLNAYDIVFGKDTHEQYFITEDLKPLTIKTKVFCYDTTGEAYQELNKENSGAYEGQMISIKKNDVYVAYIVNKNYEGKFYSTPVSIEKELDYNTLLNRPIINLVGTVSSIPILDTYPTGIYTVSGQYQISKQFQITFLSVMSNLFMVEHVSDEQVVVRKISATEIISYIITTGANGNSVKVTSMATMDKLSEYAKTTYVDKKIEALDILTTEDIDQYVTDNIGTMVEAVVDEKITEKFAELDETINQRIDMRIDEKITEVDENAISDIFAESV